jgi:hypothetical protein
MEKLFYRVGTNNTEGLWYTKYGEFSGLIHTEFKWLNASGLVMPYEPELVGYLSVADSLEHLYKWFHPSEIIRLQESGFSIFEYAATDYKFYDLYKHNVINKETSIMMNRLVLAS